MEILGFCLSMPVLWLIVAIVFAIIEGLTMGLTTIWFSGGALVALVSALLGAGLWIQISIFLVVSVLLLVFTRKIFVKKLHTGTEKTNIEALIGAEGIVIRRIEPFKPGTIRLKGQEWTAVCASEDKVIEENQKVIVERIEGVKAVVSLAPLEEGEEK